ncbi:MAG: catalase [Acidobacteriota bacterium]
MWKALAAITTLAFTLVTPIAGLTQDVPAGQKSVPEQVVDSFNTVFGVHPGARATHAKGVVLKGTFTPSASATSVSKAAHLQKKKTPVPATIRFSDSTGLPAIPDTDPGASPRGMAVKFHLPSGSKTDIVVHSFNGFPVATAVELRDFFLALAATKPGDPPPTALDTFLSTHPAAKAFVEAPKPAPVSYATLPYFGVNAFKFTNAKGAATFGRYQLQPIPGEEFLTKEQLSTMGPDYLTPRFASGFVVVPSGSNCSCKWPSEMTSSMIPRSCGRILVRKWNWARSPSPRLWPTAKPQKRSYSSCGELWFPVSRPLIR